jgi:hypothetical protein
MGAYGHSNRNNFPCKDCESRYVGCHSSCEKYQKVKQQSCENNLKIRLHINPKNCGYFKQKMSTPTSALNSKKKYR